MLDIDAVRSWLSILHGDTPGLIHICATAQWAGRVCVDVDEAVAAVADYDRGSPQGIYVRVTTLREPPPRDPVTGRPTRGGINLTHGFPALWADVDIAGPGHAEAALPPSQAEAMSIVSTSGLPTPTLWIDSGGGMYPIWLLDTPAVVESAADLDDLADLSANWQQVLGHSAASHGWRYGTGVGDLARVLRVVGTANRKTAEERMCRIIAGEGTRYPLGELHRAAADAMARYAELEPQPWADPEPPRRPATMAVAGLSPGDDYAARTTWSQILGPHGWRLLYEQGGVGYWCRPGKSRGISATTNALGTDRLRVFSTATAFDARSYGKLGALAVLAHGGDLSSAARQLREQGYGTRPDPRATYGADLAAIMGPNALTGTVVAPPSPVTPRIPERNPDGQDGGGGDAERTAPGQGSDVTADQVAALDDQARFRLEVALELRRLQVKQEARRLLDAGAWKPPRSTFTLEDELAMPDEPQVWRIEQVLPAGANVLLTAQFKAGKTTMMGALTRALVDHEPFLGRYKPDLPAVGGRVGIWNYEVSEGQYRRWLRDLDIVHTDHVSVLHLRGHSAPLPVEHVTDWAVAWLRERDVRVWIVDPFARAFIGSGDENSNGDVSVFLDRLDVIKERAGITELILPTHTGRTEFEIGQERARGATRLDDWADVRWFLTLSDDGQRFFRATGRDVEVPEVGLTYEPLGRRLVMGTGGRLVNTVVAYVTDNPGASKTSIATNATGKKDHLLRAVEDAANLGLIIATPGEPPRYFPVRSWAPNATSSRPGNFGNS